MVRASLLLLADSRLPAGAHAHSGQLEAAIQRGLIRGVSDLTAFARGRLTTQGTMSACAASMAWLLADTDAQPVRWERLDAAYDARTPSMAQRSTSRAQGRSLLRVGSRAWPLAPLERLGSAPHHAAVLGALAWAAGGSSADAAAVAAMASITASASAAVRLLSLDPLEVQAALAQLAPLVDDVAAQADAAAAEGRMLCPGSPMLDLLAEFHVTAEVRLFAS